MFELKQGNEIITTGCTYVLAHRTDGESLTLLTFEMFDDKDVKIGRLNLVLYNIQRSIVEFSVRLTRPSIGQICLKEKTVDGKVKFDTLINCPPTGDMSVGVARDVAWGLLQLIDVASSVQTFSEWILDEILDSFYAETKES